MEKTKGKSKQRLKNWAIILISVGSLIVSIRACNQSSEANKIASGANKLASEANELASKSSEREKKLFVASNRPMIDVTPTMIITGKTHALTKISVNNYSGFKAYGVSLDLRYGLTKNLWIGEWKKTKKGQGPGTIYPSKPHLQIGNLKPGQTHEETYGCQAEELDCPAPAFSGELDIEKEVCANPNGTRPVQIRVNFKNSNGHTFDEIHEYDLECTTKKNKSMSLTFISKGIVP